MTEVIDPWLLESTQTLAKTLAREFYPEVTQWECLNDLAGVISQIDHMTTGLMRKPKQDTAPPHRPWVGLTDEERDPITDDVIGFNSCCGWEDDYAKAIEAKLKEKNT